MRVRPAIKSPERLGRVLSAHYKSLVEAKSSEDVLDDYLRLLRILRTERAEVVGEVSKELSFRRGAPDSKDFDIASLLTVPLDELEAIVTDEETPRRLLEEIAVQRFSVPKGSLRQYSNRQLLIEKLKSLIHNERTHKTIGEIARRNEQ